MNNFSDKKTTLRKTQMKNKETIKLVQRIADCPTYTIF